MAMQSILGLGQAGVAGIRHVSISVDVSQTLGDWTAVNRFFGADEPNFANYPRGSALLKELGALGKETTFFRTHNLFSTGDGDSLGIPALKFGSTNVYTEDSDGNPIYNFDIVDEIFDSYKASKVKPYLQISFMPKALAVDPEPYFFHFNATSNYNNIFTGWTHPPKSYEKWRDLNYEFTKHLVERYGEEETKSWYWEVWNEPQGEAGYWRGSAEEFYKLHDFAIAGIRKALPDAAVGGPEVVADPAFLDAFLKHTASGHNEATGETGTPLDFVSFHAKGAPLFIEEAGKKAFIQMNLSQQLQQVDDAYAVIASHQKYKRTPIYIGELDPDGCAACTSQAYNYRNGLFYPAFTAASFARCLDLADERGVNLQGLITWAFEFEKTELLPTGTAFFDGFRTLSTEGIGKPVLNFHRMWSMMSGVRVKADSSGQTPLETALKDGIGGDATDVGSVATFDEADGKLYVFLWHYHDKDVEFPDAKVSVNIGGLPVSFASGNKPGVVQYRVDEDHSNAYSKWLAMGSPQEPTQQQYDELVEAAKLKTFGEPQALDLHEGGKLSLELSLPIRALSLLVITMKS